MDIKSGRFMYQSGRAGDEANKRKSPAKSGRVGITADPWFCHLHVIYLLTLSSIAIEGEKLAKLNNKWTGICHDTATLILLGWTHLLVWPVKYLKYLLSWSERYRMVSVILKEQRSKWEAVKPLFALGCITHKTNRNILKSLLSQINVTICF